MPLSIEYATPLVRPIRKIKLTCSVDPERDSLYVESHANSDELRLFARNQAYQGPVIVFNHDEAIAFADAIKQLVSEQKEATS